jgi:ADP-ribose pyrophosphatase YjhB (NUDIX family)
VLRRSRFKVEVEIAETVLSALRRRMVEELGLVRVKMFEPMVVAPRLVRAPD